jgi:hypothetical protein
VLPPPPSIAVVVATSAGSAVGWQKLILETIQSFVFQLNFV